MTNYIGCYSGRPQIGSIRKLLNDKIFIFWSKGVSFRPFGGIQKIEIFLFLSLVIINISYNSLTKYSQIK